MSSRLAQFRLIIILISALWFAVVGWFAIVQIPPSALYTKESPEVMARMENECTGTYQQRYDCKNGIAIEVTNHSGLQVTIRIALTVIGPIIGGWVYRELKRREPPPPPKPIVHDDMSWKSAAKSNITSSKRRLQGDDEEPFSLDKL